MKKYELINNQTKEEHLCNKVTIDGFDYYVSDNKPKLGDFYVDDTNQIRQGVTDDEEYWDRRSGYKIIIATNNPNIDCPKVIDEAELRDVLFVLDGQKVYTAYMNDHNSETALGGFLRGCKHGYNKSQETHPFSKEDMIEFAYFYFHEEFNSTMQNCKSSEEIFQLWKKQQPKILYYE